MSVWQDTKKQAAGLFKHGIHVFAVTPTQVTFNVLSDTSVTVLESTIALMRKDFCLAFRLY